MLIPQSHSGKRPWVSPLFMEGKPSRLFSSSLSLTQEAKQPRSDALLLFSHSVVSDSSQPQWLQRARLPCPSVSPGVCSNSCPLSRLCHFILCRPLLLLPCLSQQQGQFSSVQSLSRVRLCDPMNHSTPGLPVHHQLPESTQTHVHCVNDGI